MLRSFYLLIILLLSVTGCKLEDPEIPNEEELITTFHYRLTPASGGIPITLSFKDLDGDGGLSPEISSGKLHKNTTYLGELELLNEQLIPPVIISAEIKNEGEAHQFFFHTTGNLGITVQYDDQDSLGYPIGLKNKLMTTSVSTGTLTITLRHEPDKSAPGVMAGNIANAGGETDIEIRFDVEVE